MVLTLPLTLLPLGLHTGQRRDAVLPGAEQLDGPAAGRLHAEEARELEARHCSADDARKHFREHVRAEDLHRDERLPGPAIR